MTGPASASKRRCGPRPRSGRGHNVMQVSTAEFKKGLKIQFDGAPYTIVDFQHVKPGKGGAFVRTKLKHMRLGRVIDNPFRAVEEVGEARDFLKKNTEVEILFIESSPVTVELPNFIEIQIAKTDPGIRGDT